MANICVVHSGSLQACVQQWAHSRATQAAVKACTAMWAHRSLEGVQRKEMTLEIEILILAMWEWMVADAQSVFCGGAG